MLSRNRKNIACWLKEIWGEFPIQIVMNSLTESGYFFEDTADYSRDTEFESDVES